MITSEPSSFHEYSDFVKQFFNLIDTQTLFDSNDPEYYQNLRNEFRNAFFKLLVWQRPFLESTRGLNWPYESLNKRLNFIKNTAHLGSTLFIRTQANLFLSLLPIKGQWRYLLTMPQNLYEHPEVKKFLYDEVYKIKAELKKKHQKKLKLSQFCQILKKPNLPHEKGVLRIFSLPYIFINSNLLKLLSRLYFLYVEPPWGVLARHAWFRYFSNLEDPCLFGIGGHEDAAFLENQPGILTIKLAHGDFLEQDVILALNKEKHFDIVFNATYDDMPRKRHKFMLELLNHPKLKDITALFMGKGQKQNIDNFKDHIKEMGLEDRVTVMDNILSNDVPKYLSRCRMGIQLSLHENVCKSIYEYFRSDIPCVISSSAAGINFDIFNSRTGLAVPDIELPKAILQVLEHSSQFAPRSWFLANSGSLNSSRILNEKLKDIFQNKGYKWTSDIVPLGTSGPGRYTDQSYYKGFLPEFETLLDIFNSVSDLPIALSLE